MYVMAIYGQLTKFSVLLSYMQDLSEAVHTILEKRNHGFQSESKDFKICLLKYASFIQT